VRVAALLTQQRCGMPQRGQRIIRPWQRPIRGEHGPSVQRCLARRLSRQFRCHSDVFIGAEPVAAQGVNRGVAPGPQRIVRAGDLPRRRQGLGDPLGSEVVEDRGHHLQGHNAQRRRAGGEIAHPETAVTQPVQRRTRLGREVGHRMHRLESIEEASGQARFSAHGRS